MINNLSFYEKLILMAEERIRILNMNLNLEKNLNSPKEKIIELEFELLQWNTAMKQFNDGKNQLKKQIEMLQAEYERKNGIPRNISIDRCGVINKSTIN